MSEYDYLRAMPAEMRARFTWMTPEEQDEFLRELEAAGGLGGGGQLEATPAPMNSFQQAARAAFPFPSDSRPAPEPPPPEPAQLQGPPLPSRQMGPPKPPPQMTEEQKREEEFQAMLMAAQMNEQIKAAGGKPEFVPEFSYNARTGEGNIPQSLLDRAAPATMDPRRAARDPDAALMAAYTETFTGPDGRLYERNMNPLLPEEDRMPRAVPGLPDPPPQAPPAPPWMDPRVLSSVIESEGVSGLQALLGMGGNEPPPSGRDIEAQVKELTQRLEDAATPAQRARIMAMLEERRRILAMLMSERLTR